MEKGSPDVDQVQRNKLIKTRFAKSGYNLCCKDCFANFLCHLTIEMQFKLYVCPVLPSLLYFFNDSKKIFVSFPFLHF